MNVNPELHIEVLKQRLVNATLELADTDAIVAQLMTDGRAKDAQLQTQAEEIEALKAEISAQGKKQKGKPDDT